ncbi:MAG: hypothetical protein K6V73_00235 [Firmicutes bacterium]|nr:hypothetical protein [Bacillota bacterium]
MHEAQAIATLVLTGALALLALALAGVVAAAAYLLLRAGRALGVVGPALAQGARAWAEGASEVLGLVREARGGVAEAARALRRLAFLERILERRLARWVILLAAALEGAGAALRAWRSQVGGAGDRRGGQDERGEERADVG